VHARGPNPLTLPKRTGTLYGNIEFTEGRTQRVQRQEREEIETIAGRNPSFPAPERGTLRNAG